MKRPLLWVFLGLVVVAIGLGALAWKLAWPLQLSVNGYIALALGCLLTAGLAVVLMRLAFFSADKGYDDIERED